jgi:hypothetical protein
MPKYGIVGVTTSDDDPTTPEYNLRLVLSALLGLFATSTQISWTRFGEWESFQRISILSESTMARPLKSFGRFTKRAALQLKTRALASARRISKLPTAIRKGPKKAPMAAGLRVKRHSGVGAAE